MTDKELRKLSRLELLELLLTVSKENEMLKEKIKELKVDNLTSRNIENLSEATVRVENALKYANSITESLEVTTVKKENDSDKTSRVNSRKITDDGILTDREIYKRLLCFFAENDGELEHFPEDIRYNVRARIGKLLEGMNK